MPQRIMGPKTTIYSAIHGMRLPPFWESWYPLIGATVVAFAYFQLFNGHKPPDQFTDLLTSVISVAGIASAFLVAIQALLTSMSDNYVVKQLKGLRLHRKLSRHLMSAIQLTLLLSAVSGAGFFVDWKTPQDWHIYALTSWVFLTAWTGFASFRVVRMFANVIDTD